MQPKAYDHQRIEAKWQQYWLSHQTFKAEVDPSKPKYYVLDMFPYPSGSGLHVGHVVGYTITDIMARYKRMKGFNVLHPMGWDAFGLPAEQYAVRTGTHPAVTTQKNVDNFRQQLQSLGFSYDWNREIATCDAAYYKWTQWIFTKLYERGLAYEAEVVVNYCPALGTVLANEEVEEGKAKEGGFPVEKRPLRQWILKITAYADRLLNDLELVDWPESIKKLQINWIGRSEGARIHYALEGSQDKLTVFTTRPETIFGVTALILAPEHPLVEKIATAERLAVVQEYKKRIAAKSEAERLDATRQKSGVWTGAFTYHPITGAKLPVWIADYVLMGYGTGAVQSVPAHDERDRAFAEKFGHEIVEVLDEQERLIQSAHGDLSLNGLPIKEATMRLLDWLERHHKGERTVMYKLRDWLFSRQRYWGEPFPILHFADGSKRALESDELPLCPPELADFKPAGDGQSPLARVPEWVHITDPKTGKPARRETNTMPQWAGSCWYYLRFCDPHNDKQAWAPETEKYWLPVDLYVGGVEHATLHLLYARFWHKVLYDCGYVTTLEPFQQLRNQGLINARSYQDQHKHYVPPEEVEEREGKYFHRKSGEELHSQVDKMSKSKLNGVSPDEVIAEQGADALRLYEMFMGPADKDKIWNSEAVSGCRRLLVRLYDFVVSDKCVDTAEEEGLRLAHRLVHAVEAEIEGLRFNTAIAKMMEFANDFSKLPKYPKAALQMVVLALAPFAPHIAEELWQLLGAQETLAYAPFPKAEERYLIQATATYVVQVNGKMRGSFELPRDQDQATILRLAQEHPAIAKHLQGLGEIKKVVFVPNRLLNIVIN